LLVATGLFIKAAKGFSRIEGAQSAEEKKRK
jgi:hypothetical protein